jgi:hypothetical protein
MLLILEVSMARDQDRSGHCHVHYETVRVKQAEIRSANEELTTTNYEPTTPNVERRTLNR